MHQIPCLPEDIYNPLRDSENGTNIYRHCRTCFSNMIALRTHINKCICTAFDLGQGLVILIVARADMVMHLRHRLYMGLFLDQALCTELATQRAFCHQQVYPKAMTRHYRDQHQEKHGPTNTHMKFVQDLANFGSGRGECQLRRVKTMNVQTHTCCVLFQLAAMSCDAMPQASLAPGHDRRYGRSLYRRPRNPVGWKI